MLVPVMIDAYGKASELLRPGEDARNPGCAGRLVEDARGIRERRDRRVASQR